MGDPSVHTPVLVTEVLALLRPAGSSRVIDATVDGGGHARALLAHLTASGRLLGIERDPVLIDELRASAGAEITAGRLCLAQGSFARIGDIAAAEGFLGADAILFDLGLSSHHLAASGRGFSFDRDEPLDLRFDPDDPTLRPAADLLRRTPADTLARILATYGEERYARRIARHIERLRVRQSIDTACRLRDCILAALPAPARRHGFRSVARVFQALRIVTNGELEALEAALPQIPSLLRPGGRAAIISFHSLEDRIVKQFFRQASAAGTLTILTKKPIRPGAAELRDNPRARSARLRAAERAG